ncbi:MAG: alanine racemase [Chitinophagales bacterium]|nr:alanine racemase [Chitinophagales bacterium]MCZ2394845.1 alanine racemase [Chitinophagales bacterium]
MHHPTYLYYKNLFEGKDFPLAFVDLDLLDNNIHAIQKRVGNKSIRIASKSIRSTYILKHILQQHSIFKGIMAFTGKEALALSEEGFDDILMGYPIVNTQEIEGFCKASKEGKKMVLMVDNIKHFEMIEKEAEKLNVIQPVCIDVDMSSDYPGIHFGVYRSPINTVQRFKNLVDKAQRFPHVRIIGIMGYEAQIAGVGDASPFNGIKNSVIKFLKKISILELQRRRTGCVQYLIDKGLKPSIVNGGGTGSMDSTKKEDFITEITVGSGFYSPALFDYYEDFKFYPAAGYAIQIVRSPQKGMFTALGGGYVASGSISLDKQPKPYLPEGIQLTENEGTGEVQTPFYYKGTPELKIGDCVIFRHSKAGELCERFDKLHIISRNKIIDIVPSYRGKGWTFL